MNITKNTKFSLLVFVFLICASISYAKLTDGLVSYWKFDEHKIGEMKDELGYSNMLNHTGVNPLNKQGKIGNSIYNDPKNPSTVVSNETALTKTKYQSKSHSICYWMNQKGIYDNWYSDQLISLETAGYIGIEIAIQENNRFLYDTMTGHSYNDIYYVPNPNLCENQWCFVCNLRDNSAGIQSIYINGNLVSTQNNLPEYANLIEDFFEIFYTHLNPTPEYMFYGGMDELGFWDRPLTQEEIKKLYNCGKGMQYPFVNEDKKRGLKC